MNVKNTIPSDLQLLECTLRDGSYAVDFRFTKEDTALLSGFLSRLGFKFIEIGHGFGINASNAGKGMMPSSDRELLEIAKSNVTGSKIGMFCIPGIASLDKLRELAQAGLDFVRIGNDADSIEKAFPYIEVACENNLYTMLNFMKSYTISPKDFAQKAKVATQIGAQVIYVVDSTGGMLPEEIAEYIKEIKAVVSVKIGLHSHNNLHLATANAIQAIKSGASFIDTTLYGIGRSAGNTPTEVMLAILNNMGIDINIDLFELMDVADRYLSPLMEGIKMHDMLSVAMGAGRFHSSFFPKVEKVAHEYKTDVRKLVYIMGKKNPLAVDEKELKITAKSLGSVGHSNVDYDMTSFYSPKIRQDYISNTLRSVTELMDGLINVSAKGRRKIVVEIAPTSILDENLVLAEYVTSDRDMVMGRVYFGSIKLLETILGLIRDHISVLLIQDMIEKKWVDTNKIYTIAKRYIPKRRIMPVNDKELCHTYLIEAIRLAVYHYGRQGILVYGGGSSLLPILKICSAEFENVYWFQSKSSSQPELSNVVVLEDFNDWRNLGLKFNIILCASNPTEKDTKVLLRSLEDNGKIITIGIMPALRTKDFKINNIFSLDISSAYIGAISRWLHLSDGLSGKEDEKV